MSHYDIISVLIIIAISYRKLIPPLACKEQQGQIILFKQTASPMELPAPN